MTRPFVVTGDVVQSDDLPATRTTEVDLKKFKARKPNEIEDPLRADPNRKITDIIPINVQEPIIKGEGD